MKMAPYFSLPSPLAFRVAITTTFTIVVVIISVLINLALGIGIFLGWLAGYCYRCVYRLLRGQRKATPLPSQTNTPQNAFSLWQWLLEEQQKKTSTNRLQLIRAARPIRQALKQQQLPLHFQPIVDLHSQEIVALEVLLRLSDHKGELLLPDQFLDTAKRRGQLLDLTLLLINTLSPLAPKLPKSIKLNINITPALLCDPKAIRVIAKALRNTGLAPQRWNLEVTEDEAESLSHLYMAVQQIHHFGYTFAMDDFGAGHSTLQRLSVWHWHNIKIDRSLLQCQREAIFRNAIRAGLDCGATVTVEGIESPKQLALAKSMGAHFGQGFLLGKPMPFATVEQLFKADQFTNKFSMA